MSALHICFVYLWRSRCTYYSAVLQQAGTLGHNHIAFAQSAFYNIFFSIVYLEYFNRGRNSFSVYYFIGKNPILYFVRSSLRDNDALLPLIRNNHTG